MMFITQPKNQIVIRCLTLDCVTGYGQHAIHTARQLIKKGCEVEIEPMRIWDHPKSLPQDIVPLIRASFSSRFEWELFLSPPTSGMPKEVSHRRCIRFTMWESNRLPSHCSDALNSPNIVCVIAPSMWNILSMDACGVDKPLEHCPMGIAPEIFSKRAFPPTTKIIFGAGGRVAHGGVRKGIAEAAQIFSAAFPSEQDVELYLKVHEDCNVQGMPIDPRIKLIKQTLNEYEMSHFYSTLHCFFSMATGEGFGLMPLQAMALGRIVALPIKHGHAEYATPSSCVEIGSALAKASGYEYRGLWYEPSQHDMIKALRSIRNNFREAPDIIEQLSRQAARQAQQFTWNRYGDRLAAILNKHFATQI